MSARAVRFALLSTVVAASLVVPAFARQGGAKPAPQGKVETGVVDFWTKVGSFKIVSPSSEVKARGSLTMTFSGTVLIVGLEGTAVPSGGIRQEYKSDKQARQAYFGKGSLTVNGKWRAIQFFGRDFKGHWDGMGIMRLYGEFDDKLETGTYRIEGGDGDEAWGNGGRQIILPPAKTNQQQSKPKVEDVKKKPG